MASHHIHLPSSIRLHNVGSWLKNTNFFPENPESFTLHFHPTYSQFEPFGLAMLAAWAEHWRAKNVKIQCKNVETKGIPYAKRLGLFNFLVGGPRTQVLEQEESGRFIEIHRISKRQELSSLISDLGGIVRVPELVELVQYTVSELGANVFDHAGADAYVCVQSYPRANRVAIGIADCGRGVRGSLERSHKFNSDESAIVAATRPGVSGTTNIPYSADNNAGLGLFSARGIARLTGEYFLLGSGRAAYRLSRSKECKAPARHPADETHKLYTDLPSWQGTVVAVNIGQSLVEKSQLLAMIRGAAGDDEPMRQARGKIKFT